MYLVGLEEAEQLGLDVGRHVGNFIEEERAALGGADHAGERGLGAGERPLAVAEQLTFEHVAGNGGAVEGQNGLAGAARGL